MSIILILSFVSSLVLLGLVVNAYIKKWKEAEAAKAEAYRSATELYVNNRTITLEIQAARAEAQLYGFQRFFTELGERAAYESLYRDQRERADKLNREIAIGQDARKALAERNAHLLQTTNELTLELNEIRRTGARSVQSPSKVRPNSFQTSFENDPEPIQTSTEIDPGSNLDANKVVSLRKREQWDIRILEKPSKSPSEWFIRKKMVGNEWLGEIELFHYLEEAVQATFHVTSLKPGEFMPLTQFSGVLLCSAPGCKHLVVGDNRMKSAEVCGNECRKELDKYKLKLANK